MKAYLPREGDVLDSILNKDSLEERKADIQDLGEKLKDLERMIELDVRKSYQLQRKLERLQCGLRTRAEELTAQGKNPNATVYHLKGGQMIPFDDQRWIGDWRTGIAFSEDQLIKDFSLPLRDQQEVEILDVNIVWEKTDSGDLSLSKGPLRHVILREKVTDTGASTYPDNRLPTLTLSLGLPTYSAINYLKLVGFNQLLVAGVSYLDEDGVEQSLSYISSSDPSIVRLSFSAIRTGRVLISLQQKTPVGSGPIEIRDYLNERLRGADFSQFLPSGRKEAAGYLFDFSIRSISVGLRTYEPIGLYRGRPVELRNPVGIRLSSTATAVGGTLPRGSYPVDHYIGLKLEDKSLLLDEVLPVPDSSPLQIEFLAGNEAQLKFRPDFTKNLNLIEVKSVALETVVLDAAQTGTKYDHSPTAAEAGTYTTDTWLDPVYGDHQSVTLNVSDGGTSEAFLQTFVGSFTPSFTVEHIGLVDSYLDGYLPVTAPWWGTTEALSHYERVVRNSILFSVTETSRTLSGTQLSSVDVRVDPATTASGFGLNGVYLQHMTELGSRAQSLYSTAVSSTSYTAPSDVVAAWGGSVASRAAYEGYLYKGFSARVVYQASDYVLPVLHYGDLESAPFNSEGPASSLYWNPRRVPGKSSDSLADRGITAAQEVPAVEAINNGYSASLYMFTTETVHGFKPGDLIGMRGWKGYYIVAYVESSTRFGVIAPAFPTVDLSKPIWVFNAVEHKDPMKVFAGKRLLQIGSDYVLSVDSGRTWLGYFPTDGTWARERGDVLIKFLVEDSDFWVEYSILPNQALTKRVSLKGGRIYLDKSLRNSSGVVAPIFVMRNRSLYDPAEVSLLSLKIISGDGRARTADKALRVKTTRGQRNAT